MAITTASQSSPLKSLSGQWVEWESKVDEQLDVEFVFGVSGRE